MITEQLGSTRFLLHRACFLPHVARRMAQIGWCIAIVVTLLASFNARADRRQARDLFSAAEESYATASYEQALGLYEQAYAAEALPAFLFNIGQCHMYLAQTETLDIAGKQAHIEQALRQFEAYLTALPSSRNRQLVIARADEARALLKQSPRQLSGGARSSTTSTTSHTATAPRRTARRSEAALPPPLRATRPGEEVPSAQADALMWAALGAGGALVVGAIVLGAVVSSRDY